MREEFDKVFVKGEGGLSKVADEIDNDEELLLIVATVEAEYNPLYTVEWRPSPRKFFRVGRNDRLNLSEQLTRLSEFVIMK